MQMKAFVSLIVAMFLASVCTALLGTASFLLFGGVRYESLANPWFFVSIGIMVLHLYLMWRFYSFVRRRLGHDSTAGSHV
jgi:hypothetical protein